jgi:type IV pilus assembly protein PilQ
MARAQAEMAEEESRMAAANPWSADAQSSARARTYPAELSAYTNAGAVRLSDDRISMDVQGADMKTVLRSISEFSGANIITGPDVEGAVTIHLVDVPWREALDIILKANGYGLREEYGMFRIQSLDVLHDEEIDIATTRQKKEDLEPLESKVIELNYVNAKEMQQAMDKATSKRGSIAIEKGSNAIIINDIPKITERIAAMAVSLDRRVSMVEIVAKMVDLDVEATRELGIQWDFMNIMSADFHATMNAFSGQPLAAPFAGFNIGTVQSWGQVMAAIEALERDNKANIISNPRITTADNNEASILVGKEIPLIVSDEAGNPITELKKTGITLRVTPHVNSDGTITMDLHPEISDLSSQATVQGGLIISISEADTRVIVRDGETAVIGGLLSEIDTRTVSGVPGLKDVPLVGALFRYESKTKKKRELVIFVTPKLVEFGEALEGGMQ